MTFNVTHDNTVSNILVNSHQQNDLTNMATRQRSQSLYLHFRDQLHVPHRFNSLTARDILYQDVANLNQRGILTTIFDPAFNWQ